MSLPPPLAQHSRWTPGDDIVRGAEPEREAPRANVMRCNQATQKRAVDLEEVIELTDSGSDDALPKATQLSPRRPTSKIPPPSNTPVHHLPLSLSRFAFQANPTKAASRFMSTAILQKDSRSSDNAAEKGNTARGWKKARLVEINVSESNLSRLEKCVCCQIRWTTRKTTTQKLRHIQVCSRKHSHTSETVSILIRKELNLPTESRVEEPPTASNTHLEDVVQGALPKKGGRRKKVGSTICEYNGETRKTMLKRARAILGPVIHFDDETGGALAFAASTQAVQFPPRAALTGGNGVIASDLPPSPTWSFLPSKLKFQAQQDTSRETPPSFPPTLREGLSSHPGSTNSSEQDISVDTTREYSTLPPDVRSPVELRKSLLSPHEKILTRKIPKKSGSHVVKDSGRINKSSGSASGIIDPPKRRRGRPPSGSPSRGDTKRKQQERKKRLSAALEQWREELRTKIMQDTDLYKRILRYEPIHLDTFQNLAPPSGTPAALRKKVVDFLDQQAIKFYGYNMSNMLRKRKHRSKMLSSRLSKTP